MLIDLFGFFILAASAVAFADARAGLRLAIVAGLLQDPVRKLTPGTPPILAISALPIVAAALVGAFGRDPQLLTRLARAYPRLVRSLEIFALSLAPGVLILLVSYGLAAWTAVVLGLFGYLTPLLAMVWGFNFTRSADDLRRLLAFYCLTTAVALTGALFEFLQLWPDWPALGTAALGAPWIRFTPSGLVIRLITGFFRSPDVMGWHAATLTMAALTLALARDRPRARAFLLLAVWAAFCVLICGRRKAIVMPALWAAVALFHFLRARRLGGAVGLIATVAVALGGLLFASGEAAIGPEYYAYAASIASDAPRRLQEGTFGAVWWTLVQSGALGAGIGSASQGMQHLGGGVAQGWQESGISKLAAELGLPGLVCGLLVALQLARAGLRAVRQSSDAAPAHSLVVGLAGMAAANAASFVVSHQVYGDLLVMTLSAFFVGVLLSAPRWCGPPVAAPAPARARRAPAAGEAS